MHTRKYSVTSAWVQRNTGNEIQCERVYSRCACTASLGRLAAGAFKWHQVIRPLLGVVAHISQGLPNDQSHVVGAWLLDDSVTMV